MAKQQNGSNGFDSSSKNPSSLSSNTAKNFLSSPSGKTKSNALEVPSISLPKGGGAIKGIDEKFSVNAINGTSSFSIPLPVSPSRGVTPSLSLSYNSGAGNGIFGLGWTLGLSSIKRKTDKGLPQYLDSIDSDIFLFSEAEDLVPVLKKKNSSNVLEIDELSSPDGNFMARFYRPRIEGLFARIERWTKKDNGEIKWRVITRDNITTLFGWTAASRIVDPENPGRIYEWLPEFVFDDKGNCCCYKYKAENEVKAKSQTLHNKNRFRSNGEPRYTNRYLETVLYGNKNPFDGFASGVPSTVANDYLFKIFFDYTGNTSTPIDKADNAQWAFRDDAFSDYKAGFEIRTTRLCQRILLFHQFNEYNGLVKSMEFEYDFHTTKGEFTFLKKITSKGHIKPNSSTSPYTSRSLPPIEFEYQAHSWNKEVKTILAEDLVHAPAGLDESAYQFTDLFNEGLAGILTEQANAWYYKHNLGNGKFAQAKLVTPKPSFAGLGGQLQLVDLDGDGGKQLANYSTEPKGFFELTDEEEWIPYKSFRQLPNMNISGGHARMLDLNGDGKPEVLLTEDHAFTWYESEGRKGFTQARHTIKQTDEEEGPHVVFADSTQSIFLADMSGDGMTDIVRIRNGEVCYWPNLGYGKFGRKVGMDNAPLFDHSDSFNPTYIKLADIDGSGTTDIIYLGKNKFSCWLNRSGNSFLPTPEFEIPHFPEIHSEARVTVTDLLGNGVACIVWSSALAKDAHAPLRYIDLMDSKKPHVMTHYRNNMGKEVTLEYKASTHFYLEDKKAGKPWVTKLHFPVHCLSKVITEDKISGYYFINSYKYHHGYYDHAEREFRGFGMVEQFDHEKFERWLLKTTPTNLLAENEAFNQPIVHTKTWAHTGASIGRARLLNQFSHEYWYEEMAKQGFAASHSEYPLPDATIVDEAGNDITAELDAQDWQEALRACKGITLRAEVFADDTDEKKALTPYSVATHNCIIKRLQPREKNKHAVFLAKESEAITYSYERNVEDPRIAHTLNIKFDDLGNVLESASVVYPRKATQIPTDLPEITKDAQKATYVTYTKNSFTRAKGGATHDINQLFVPNKPDAYRLRLPFETRTFELTRVKKTGDHFTIKDFDQILLDAKSEEKEYFQWEDDPSINPIDPTKAFRRLIEHVRTVYRDNDLLTALALGEVDSMAIPYESYQLAYTPILLHKIYSAKATDVKLEELMRIHGKFFPMDSKWWIRSGRTNFIDTSNPLANTLAKAKARFFLPISYIDPYDSKTQVEYDNHSLFVKKTIDALANETEVTLFNYRTLSPQQMKDINDNLTEVITDELGLVKAMAVLGKGSEADELKVNDTTRMAEETDGEQNEITTFFQIANSSGVCQSNQLQDSAQKLLHRATARFVYDFDAYQKTGKPAVVASIVRETHYRKENGTPSKLQLSFEYTNGLGQVIMKKVQAEPGKAKGVTIGPNDIVTPISYNTVTPTSRFLRWIGNGRSILNNKGNPIKQYEPFFSVSPKFEAEKELVETGVTPLMYYDALGRLIKTEMPDGTFSKVEFTSWYQKVFDANDTVKDSQWFTKRKALPPTNPERKAADKTELHAETPSVLHFDTLGRPVLQIENNGKDASLNDILYRTKIELDIEGNLRRVIDAREIPENNKVGNLVMQYQFDMLGNQVYQNSMDAGERWLMINTLGQPLKTWDARGHVYEFKYDDLHRPTEKIVTGIVGMITTPFSIEKTIYGEGLANAKNKNLRGQVYQHYDSSGLTQTEGIDFNGNLLEVRKRLTNQYDAHAIDWSISPRTKIETEEFVKITEYDALNRMTKLTNWYSQETTPGIYTPTYNPRGLLISETLSIGRAVTTAIKEVLYDAKGQRTHQTLGCNTVTHYKYDTKTFRLLRLYTSSPNTGGAFVQDLHYTYDPVGNITEIKDSAIEPVFFNNQKVEARNQYVYDAIYRLTEATGRENGLVNGASGRDIGEATKGSFPATDPNSLRNYTQHYTYDEVGNISQVRHQAGLGAHTNNWTRAYFYYPDNNRLKRTEVGGTLEKEYRYDLHGSILNLGPTEILTAWNYDDMLHRVETATDQVAWYNYASDKQRSRKRRVKGIITEDRIYLEGFELYRRLPTAGGTEAEIIETHHLMNGSERVLMVENVVTTDNNQLTEGILHRYQYSNHLGTVGLELNNDADIITYEEFHPYGTTAYQLQNQAVKCKAKRYRYTGMERDEETGLSYHTARYYVPWLGRWLSPDPNGIADGLSIYVYSRDNPISNFDVDGLAIRYFQILFLGADATDNELDEYRATPDAHNAAFLGTFAAAAGSAALVSLAVGPSALASAGRVIASIARSAITKAISTSLNLASALKVGGATAVLMTAAVESETVADLGNVAIASYETLVTGGSPQSLGGLLASVIDLGTGPSPIGDVNSARVLSGKPTSKGNKGNSDSSNPVDLGGVLGASIALKRRKGDPTVIEIEEPNPSNMDLLISTTKPSSELKLRYENPGQHDPSGLGPNRYNPRKSVLPSNHIELFKKSVLIGKNRYAIDENGNVHTFQNSNAQQPVWHWAGQENGRTRSGELYTEPVPGDIRRQLMEVAANQK